MRFRGITGAFGSLAFRGALLAFGASVLVARLPFSNDILGFLPGFFRSLTTWGAGGPLEGFTTMPEFRCADASFATCADGESGLDCGGEERSAELERETSGSPDARLVAITLYPRTGLTGSKGVI